MYERPNFEDNWPLHILELWIRLCWRLQQEAIPMRPKYEHEGEKDVDDLKQFTL